MVNEWSWAYFEIKYGAYFEIKYGAKHMFLNTLVFRQAKKNHQENILKIQMLRL